MLFDNHEILHSFLNGDSRKKSLALFHEISKNSSHHLYVESQIKSISGKQSYWLHKVFCLQGYFYRLILAFREYPRRHTPRIYYLIEPLNYFRLEVAHGTEFIIEHYKEIFDTEDKKDKFLEFLKNLSGEVEEIFSMIFREKKPDEDLPSSFEETWKRFFYTTEVESQIRGECLEADETKFFKRIDEHLEKCEDLFISIRPLIKELKNL